MLTGRIRDARTITVDVEGDSLASIRAALDEKTPSGYELLSAPVCTPKTGNLIQATGTFAPRRETREIEAADLEGLRRQVPEGWQLLAVWK